MHICRKCGRKVSADDQFCENCGARIERDTSSVNEFCESCGARVDSDAAFCGNCGQKINLRRNPGRKKAVVITVMTACLLILMAVYFGSGVLEKSQRTENRVISATPPVTATPFVSPVPSVTEPPESSMTEQPLPGGNTYLFNSDSEVITEEILSAKTQDEVRLILNEMYARHGYIFQSARLREYFSAQPWYQPRYTSDLEAESCFNSIEIRNKQIIVQYEIDKGWR